MFYVTRWNVMSGEMERLTFLSVRMATDWADTRHILGFLLTTDDGTRMALGRADHGAWYIMETKYARL